MLISVLTSVACRPRNQASVLHDDWHAGGVVLRCGRKTTCISQAVQSQVSSCDEESAHVRLPAIRLQSVLLIGLRQQHEWLLPYVTTRTAGGLKLSDQTSRQRKTGKTRRGKQERCPTDCCNSQPVIDQLTVVSVLQDLCTSCVPLRRSL